jgi:hypothetical protein
LLLNFLKALLDVASLALFLVGDSIQLGAPGRSQGVGLPSADLGLLRAN